MFKWIHKFGSPPFVYGFSKALSPWVGIASLGLFAWGLYLGLVKAPPDYEQGEVYRIMYVHVPAAWMSMFVYVVMAMSSAVFIIWRMKLADAVAEASAFIGASFTFLALVTGSIWGRPTWGTWWEWDARLTSELVLLFLYLGYIALRSAIEHPQSGARAAAILAIVGVVNIPIIHFSVEWWNSLHQPASITRADGPTMHISMIIPLFVMLGAFQLYYFHHLLVKLRVVMLERDHRTKWVAERVQNGRL
jgi:heme exporter protein C